MATPLKISEIKVGKEVSWFYRGRVFTSTIKEIKNGRAYMNLDEWNVPLTELLPPLK